MEGNTLREFLYKHHKLTVATVHTAAVLCAVVGFAVAYFLSPTEELNTEGLISLFVGLGLTLVIEIGAYTVSPFRYGMKLLLDLGKLSRGRESFSLGERVSTNDKIAEISHRLEKLGYAERITRGSDGFVCRWSRVAAIIGEKNTSEYSKFSLNLYLYRAENLDTGVWQSIKDDLTERLREDREEQRDKRGSVGIVNSVCILADFVDTDVREQARRTLTVNLSDNVTLRGIRVCVGAPSSDIYYLCSERDLESNSRTNKSLEIIARGVFGVGVGKLSKLGNGYTKEYLELLDKAYNTSLSELAVEAREKAACEMEQIEKEWDADPLTSMSEGEIVRRGDAVFCVYGGILVKNWILLPEEARKCFTDDDFGDLEDMLYETDGQEEEDTEEPAPSVSEDYRGEIVLTAEKYGFTLPGGKMKKLAKEDSEAVFLKVRDYLLGEGFERVYYYNEKKKTLDET